jgi:hypothetical protein
MAKRPLIIYYSFIRISFLLYGRNDTLIIYYPFIRISFLLYGRPLILSSLTPLILSPYAGGDILLPILSLPPPY